MICVIYSTIRSDLCQPQRHFLKHHHKQKSYSLNSMPSTNEVLAWKADAQRTLERGQQLSSRANDILQQASFLLNKQFLELINKASTQLEASKMKKTHFLSLVDNVTRTISEYINSYKLSIQNQLIPEVLRLDAVLKSLESVEVPHFLTPSEKDTVHHLSDFVSWQELNLLRTNIDVHQQNVAQIFSLLQKEVTKLKQSFTSGCTRHSQIVKQYELKVAEVKVLMSEAASKAPPKNRSNIIYTILKENKSLENELTSVLKMLTNHFDQCCLAVEWNSTTDDESLRVLQEDSMELTSVLKEVEAIHDIIENNCARADQFVQQRTPSIEHVIHDFEEWNDWCTSFEDERIIQILLLFLSCKSLTLNSSLDLGDEMGQNTNKKEDEVKSCMKNSPIKEYAGVLEQLCRHYEQFKSVYETHYLTELHHERFVYPRQFLKQLDNYLNVHLRRLDEEERERRRDWLQKFGEYIPLLFYLPGEANQPQVIQVISEGLEEIESEGSHESEAQLLELIKKYRVK